MSYASMKSASLALAAFGLFGTHVIEARADGRFDVAPTDAYADGVSDDADGLPALWPDLGDVVIDVSAVPVPDETMRPGAGFTTAKPVAFVWEFLALNREHAPRKALIAELDSLGLNPNMIRTQTSRAYNSDFDPKEWLYREKCMRDGVPYVKRSAVG